MRLSNKVRLALVATAVAIPAVAATANAAITTTTVTVSPSASNEVTNTGVTLTASDKVTVTASGSWYADSHGQFGTFGPEGSSVPTDAGTAACLRDPLAPVGALIGSLDNGTTWTYVSTGPTVLSGAGTLLLAQNDCPGFYGDNGGSVSATITPVAPVPVSAASCKNGGWKTFGTYKNQGDCVSFVSTGKSNPDATS